MSDFEKIISDERVHIGYIYGSRTVLFIKTGQGGSIYGYENRYLDLALRIREKYGFSVFVSATSTDGRDVYDYEMSLIQGELSEDIEIYYMGVSKGGLIGCWYGKDNPKINRIVAVNAPLMVNFYNKTLPAIKALGRDRISMVYGSLDPSFKYVPFISNYTDVEIIENADHNLINVSFGISEIAEKILLKSLPSGDPKSSNK